MSRTHLPDYLRERVREQAGNRCGYCLSRQEYVWGVLEVEHIIPLKAGGENTEENLWLACRPCNSSKSNRVTAEDPVTNKNVPLFNPRSQSWWDHFSWNEDGTLVIGLTPTGRATVVMLRLNESRRVAMRKLWVEVGWHPPAH